MDFWYLYRGLFYFEVHLKKEEGGVGDRESNQKGEPPECSGIRGAPVFGPEVFIVRLFSLCS